MDCSPPGSSVHGIFQARMLEWIIIPFSRNLSNSGIEPRSLALQVDFFFFFFFNHLSHQGSLLGLITYRFSYLRRQLGIGLERQDWGEIYSIFKGWWVFLRLHVWVFAISKHFSAQLFEASWNILDILHLSSLCPYLSCRLPLAKDKRHSKTQAQ